MQTFYWHDYETWGINPAFDRPSQFAGVRTDADFNVIGEPLNVLCAPALDVLPHVDACLVTKITPQFAAAGGIPEYQFFAKIHAELSMPGTCGVGYNSIRFDDEVTRYGLYRNFYDPYGREWQQGNSRWDIIDMVRLCYAVRPEGIEWPMRELDSGGRVVSLRLEKLTEMNGISHQAAHDALSDVYATIAVAKLIRDRQPKLYQHVLELRSKAAVQQALALGSGKPRLHISSKFGAGYANGSLILPIAQNPQNKNEVICVDLRYSPQPLFDCDVETLARLMYTKVDELPAGTDRIPLKSVHLNRCPIVLSTGLLDDQVIERLQLDVDQCEQHRKQLLANDDLVPKLISVYQQKRFENVDTDVDAMLYEGFFSPQDRTSMQAIPSLDGAALAEQSFSFVDRRLDELLFRYRARNFPATLSADEKARWHEHCRDRHLGQQHLQHELAYVEKRLAETAESLAREASEEDIARQNILSELRSYLVAMKQQLAA